MNLIFSVMKTAFFHLQIAYLHLLQFIIKVEKREINLLWRKIKVWWMQAWVKRFWKTQQKRLFLCFLLIRLNSLEVRSLIMEANNCLFDRPTVKYLKRRAIILRILRFLKSKLFLYYWGGINFKLVSNKVLFKNDL